MQRRPAFMLISADGSTDGALMTDTRENAWTLGLRGTEHRLAAEWQGELGASTIRLAGLYRVEPGHMAGREPT